MNEKRRFVRIYYDDLETDYPEIYYDPTAGWTFVRLMAGADKAWPSLPELPRSVRRADLKQLVNLGLVTLEANGRYSCKGYARERSARNAIAKAKADKRWDAARAAAADTDADAVA